MTNATQRLLITGPHYKIYDEWQDDRSCTFHVEYNDGSAFDTTLGWSTPELARQMHSAAILTVEKRADGLMDLARDANKRITRRWVTPFGAVFAGVVAGPPTWWLPRVKIGKRPDGAHRVMVGWLRRAYFVVLDRRKR